MARGARAAAAWQARRLPGAAIREAWAAGNRGGRAVERAEIQADLRRRPGHYDLRDGDGATREILAYLDRESQ